MRRRQRTIDEMVNRTFAPRQQEVDADTQTWGMGPLELKCDLARCHGWSEEDLEAAAQLLREIGRKYGGRARRRYAERYREEYGVVVFIGPLPERRAP